MPQTYKAVKMATLVMQHTWKCYANGAPIKGCAFKVKNPTGEYARSIKIRYISPLNTEIFTEYGPAKGIEEGTKGYDMKKTHPYGPKGRVSKKGVPYNIIPFRHGAPGTSSYTPMPEELYAKIQSAIRNGELALSKVVEGKRMEPNYAGELIPRANYKWGTRIMGSGINQLEGMVVMNVSTPKSTRNEYMTFRVISANSPAFKWLQKPRQGLHLTRYVVQNTKSKVENIIIQGMREDLGL